MTKQEPVKILKQYTKAHTFNKVYKQEFKGKGVTSLVKKMDYNVEAKMLSNCLVPGFENHFQIKIDNSRHNSEVSAVRLALCRTVKAGKFTDKTNMILVKDEELANVTHGGGRAN